jgi:hypothetical protein
LLPTSQPPQMDEAALTEWSRGWEREASQPPRQERERERERDRSLLQREGAGRTRPFAVKRIAAAPEAHESTRTPQRQSCERVASRRVGRADEDVQDAAAGAGGRAAGGGGPRGEGRAGGEDGAGRRARRRRQPRAADLGPRQRGGRRGPRRRRPRRARLRRRGRRRLRRHARRLRGVLQPQAGRFSLSLSLARFCRAIDFGRPRHVKPSLPPRLFFLCSIIPFSFAGLERLDFLGTSSDAVSFVLGRHAGFSRLHSLPRSRTFVLA